MTDDQAKKFDKLIADMKELRDEMHEVRKHQSLFTSPLLDGRTMLDLIRDAVIAEQRRNTRMQVLREARGLIALAGGSLISLGVFKDQILEALRGFIG